MKTSELLSRLVTVGNDLQSVHLRGAEKDVEELQQDEPETYELFMKIVTLQKKQYELVVAEVDLRFPSRC
jgi:hypothetical protein